MEVSEEEALAAALNEQQELMNENADLHKSCDFTLDNFDARQAALDQEMDGLREATSVLSGSNFGFLQTKWALQSRNTFSIFSCTRVRALLSLPI